MLYLPLLILGIAVRIIRADLGPQCRPADNPGAKLNVQDCNAMLNTIPDWTATVTFWRHGKPNPPKGSFITSYTFSSGSCVGYIGVPDGPGTIQQPSELSSFALLKGAMTTAVQQCVIDSAGSGKGGGGAIGPHNNLVYFIAGQGSVPSNGFSDDGPTFTQSGKNITIGFGGSPDNDIVLNGNTPTRMTTSYVPDSTPMATPAVSA